MNGQPHITTDEAAARLDVQHAGYCVLCNRIVARADDGSCEQGHPAAGISGNVVLIEGEPLPVLPSFNWAAFLVPPVWGPAHGLWVGAIFLPVWLFADSIIGTAIGGGAGSIAGAIFVAVVTLAAQVWFARHANGLAWRQVCDRVDVDAFVRRERRWLVAMVPLAVLLYGWAVYYRLILAG